MLAIFTLTAVTVTADLCSWHAPSPLVLWGTYCFTLLRNVLLGVHQGRKHPWIQGSLEMSSWKHFGGLSTSTSYFLGIKSKHGGLFMIETKQMNLWDLKRDRVDVSVRRALMILWNVLSILWISPGVFASRRKSSQLLSSFSFLFSMSASLSAYSLIRLMVPHRDQTNIEPISGLNH